MYSFPPEARDSSMMPGASGTQAGARICNQDLVWIPKIIFGINYWVFNFQLPLPGSSGYEQKVAKTGDHWCKKWLIEILFISFNYRSQIRSYDLKNLISFIIQHYL